MNPSYVIQSCTYDANDYIASATFRNTGQTTVRCTLVTALNIGL